MSSIRAAVLGAGVFGRHHLRILRDCPRAQLAGVFDTDAARREAAASEFGCRAFSSLSELASSGVQAAVVAAPTAAHADLGCRLFEAGIDALIEKPIAATQAAAQRLIDAAARRGRILQVGHLERFNPAIAALKRVTSRPLFFEIHRLSVFSPRSLDVDVVLDLMIHDIDIVLDLAGERPSEIRAAGLSILSGKVDIASVRLAFPGGCVANLTASRVSTGRVRKLRLFQPHQYISVDYERQDAVACSVADGREIVFETLPVEKDEPLRLEVDAFLECAASRRKPLVSGQDGMAALVVSLGILDKIEEHARLIATQLKS